MAAASLSAVIEEQIKALCLTSFPCGSGSWNQSCFKHGRYLSTVMEWESDNPQEESMDNLNDLLTDKHSPWKLEDDCGPETHNLRQLAITRPENITNQFIYSYFKCLRVINKEVSEVDEQLLQFHNLEELILSVNKIKTIDSSNLPRTLKVLELCSNQISSLEDLSTNPPPTLQHLGLAYNKIKCSTENIYLTTDHWPHLVSLDLSFNDLSDLFDLVPKLCTLKKLRLLNLQGNPLMFIYSYRAYTIDSLPDLCMLDDIPILPDERHQCLGLSKNNDGLGNSAQIYVSIGKIKGIPNPISISDLQSTEGYPVITYNYYVTYEFVEDQLSQQLVDTQVSVQATNMKMFEDSREKSPAMLNFPVLTGTYRTGGAHWMEVIDCVYKRKHTVSDLLALKAFLQSGMKVTVTEEKTLSWLLYPEKIEKTKDVSESGKKGAIKDKGRSSSKGSKPDSKSKKKKETIDDLRHDAPIVRTLGSVIMPLNNLTQGEMQVSSLCNFEILRTEMEIPATAGEKNVKKSKDQKPEGGQESVGHRKTELSSGKGKRKNTAELKSQEEQVLQHPEPLTAEVHIHLHTWKSPSAHQTA